MTSIYPKIPGYIINHDPTKVDFKKISSQRLEKLSSGTTVKKEPVELPRLNPLPTIQVRDEKSKSSSQQTFVNHFQSENIEQFQPDWVKLDKQVLRFFGYFKESVVESNVEYARIRRLILCYYLVDDTVDIAEEKEVNSGIWQGPFLKRTKIKMDDGNFMNWRDLLVGKDIYVYGKVVTLVDCDQYTKEFFTKQGITQPGPGEYPKDTFHNSVLKKFVPKKDNQMKDYLEHKLGGGKVPSQKQFLENDRKVLKFFAKFETLKYIIHYYLSDDTVEIREVHYHNSGVYPFPLFLKRNKLPKRFAILQPGDVFETDHYKDSDIEPFMTLWVFNRPFIILGCDGFTQNYYMTKYNKKFPLNGFEDPPQKERNNMIIPPHNGFGDEVDSLENCMKLIPKAAKKDYFKYIDNDKITLRFFARLNTKIPEDMDRRYLISFFLADDTLQVYEMPNKNSGIWEGKFLERKKYKNIENDNKLFTISDFELNKSIRINTYSFHILDADDYTKKWMQDNLK
jgi:hypothetical protein